MIKKSLRAYITVTVKNGILSCTGEPVVLRAEG